MNAKAYKAELECSLHRHGMTAWSRFVRIRPKLKNIKPPQIVVNNRLYRTAGFCWQESGLIELGGKFFFHSVDYSQIMIYQILPHELAHYADFMLYGASEDSSGHGRQWQKLMLDYGVEPARYHSMDLTQ